MSILFFLRSLKIFRAASRSLGATLKMNGRAGEVIFFAAAQEIRGILPSSIFGMIARVFPEVDGPMTATTRSFLIRRSTAVTAFVASVSSS